MPTTKEDRFLAKEYALTGELSEVPGLGTKGIENLQSKGINTTYQLIGKFLELERSEQKMFDFLVEQGNGAQHVKHTARTIKMRVAKVGFKCNIKLSGHVVKTATSMFDDTKKTDFLQRKLTQKLSTDFTGIKEEKGFHKAGIRTTDQLFAAFLAIIDNPDVARNTKKCDEFYTKLTALGAAAGFKSVIIYQLQTKLAVGIDTHGAAALVASLPALAEVDEAELDEDEFDAAQASRGTSPRARTSPARRRPADAQSSSKVLFDEKTGAEAKKAGGSSSKKLLLMIALPILLAGAYYALAPAEGLAALAAPAETAELPTPNEGGTWI